MNLKLTFSLLNPDRSDTYWDANLKIFKGNFGFNNIPKVEFIELLNIDTNKVINFKYVGKKLNLSGKIIHWTFLSTNGSKLAWIKLLNS